MKLFSLLAAASVSVISANAGLPVPAARAYYKVKINADATLQTAPGETSNAKVTTTTVIEALIDQLAVPSAKASDFDIIACFAGSNDQIMEEATFFLARARGASADRYKIEIPTDVFDTEGGAAVFKRVFTANNSTAKVSVTDSFSGLELDTRTLDISAEGLAKATVTVKDLGEGKNPYLSMVNNNFKGHHVVKTASAEGVGAISATIAGAVKPEAFDALPIFGTLP